ncbi:hypothetical protein COY26_04600 [Candidatus Woesearchaeota archaeon CG_4_10_14_0_2_um_filter_33_10]|nr:MAG: hypothetical protein COY26_04600 [Candidatus Woesearchaeota archaeon CG_4_10_14_0_2_um_filter_33_10]
MSSIATLTQCCGLQPTVVYFKTPIIILTATILLLIYISILILMSAGLSFLLLLVGVPYSNIISVIIALFALIFIIILHIKNRNKIKEAIK